MLSNKALVTQATKTGYYAGVNIVTPVLFQAWLDGISGVIGTVELYGSNDQRALQTPDVATATGNQQAMVIWTFAAKKA